MARRCTRPASLLTPLLLLACTGVALAAEPPAADVTLAKAALPIRSFDQLAERCQQESGGFSEAQQREVAAWERSHHVPALRAHVQAALSTALRQQVDEAARQVVERGASRLGACAAAVGMTRVREAQFASELPALVAALSPSAAGGAPQPSATVPIRGIEGFAFDSCTRVGYGGMVMVTACPLVLFKNGELLRDVEGLAHRQGLAAHKAAHPAAWTRWQASAGKDLQVLGSKGWRQLGFTAVYRELPDGFRLDGTFRAVGGSGNTALGGGQAVAAWRDYRFTPDGRVERGGGAGATSGGGGVAVATRSEQAMRRGAYRIDGVMLRIRYDDGATEDRVLIADPKDQGRGTIWLDGEGYVRR